MTSSETEVAVLFADAVGSTRLYELFGDNRARELILVCIDVMRESTERNRGTVIKTIGDEILSIFPTTDDAVNASSEMHQDIAARPELLVEGQHVSIRIGCHFGPVVFEREKVAHIDGVPILGRERYYLAHTTVTEITLDNQEDLERADYLEHRWWSLAELEATDEVIFPEGFAERINALLGGS